MVWLPTFHGSPKMYLCSWNASETHILFSCLHLQHSHVAHHVLKGSLSGLTVCYAQAGFPTERRKALHSPQPESVQIRPTTYRSTSVESGCNACDPCTSKQQICGKTCARCLLSKPHLVPYAFFPACLACPVSLCKLLRWLAVPMVR